MPYYFHMIDIVISHFPTRKCVGVQSKFIEKRWLVYAWTAASLHLETDDWRLEGTWSSGRIYVVGPCAPGYSHLLGNFAGIWTTTCLSVGEYWPLAISSWYIPCNHWLLSPIISYNQLFTSDFTSHVSFQDRPSRLLCCHSLRQIRSSSTLASLHWEILEWKAHEIHGVIVVVVILVA